MAQYLIKQPPSVAPWPPARTDIAAQVVKPGEDLGAFCKRLGISLQDFLRTNFAIDIGHPDWQFHFNWCMKTHGIAKAWTANGNCRFVGGEVFYTRIVKKMRPPPADRGELVQWFLQEVIPARTIGPGVLRNTDFMLARGGKVIERMRTKAADPNGICGAVADYVVQRFQDFGDRSRYKVGYILWSQLTYLNHVANVMMPVDTVLSYTRDFSGAVSAQAPDGGVALPFSVVEQWPVLDLYFMKVSTVGRWWHDVSYLGWGRLDLDPIGEFINR